VRWTFFRPKPPAPPNPDKFVSPTGEVMSVDEWLQKNE
jgi:hypothetical protein